MESFSETITKTTRRIVIDWMHEVCEELCSALGRGSVGINTCNQMYVHAVHNLDRYA